MTKKKLTKDQEFEILKLVLDKFLWAGLFILLYGFYVAVQGVAIQTGFWIMAAGAVLLIIFMSVLLKEYEILK
ncbi:MAG: hypothetical protein ACMXYD_00670 [Candidatus Woesearchaeota archaeon]